VKHSGRLALACVLIALLTEGFALAFVQSAPDKLSAETLFIKGKYIGPTENQALVEISVSDCTGGWKPMDFAPAKDAILDKVQKGDAIGAVYKKKLSGRKVTENILLMLRRLPQIDFAPDLRKPPEGFGVAEIIPETEWLEVKYQVAQNEGRSPGHTRVGGFTGSSAVYRGKPQGIVTDITPVSPYEYRVKLKPVFSQDSNASGGEFIIDLTTTIDGDLEKGAEVSVDLRKGQKDNAVANALAVAVLANAQGKAAEAAAEKKKPD
jgi:hypothetical protein